MAVVWTSADVLTADKLNADLDEIYHNFARVGPPAGTATITVDGDDLIFDVQAGKAFYIKDIGTTVFWYEENLDRIFVGNCDMEIYIATGKAFKIFDGAEVFSYLESTEKFTFSKDVDIGVVTIASTGAVSGVTTLSLSDNITMADGKYIGQSAGPQIIFDEIGNRLEIMGCDVGVGINLPLGKMHIYKASSGQTPHGNANTLIIENSSHAGISILSGDTSQGNVWFGDVGSNTVGRIQYTHGTDVMELWAGGAIQIAMNSSAVGIGVSAGLGKLHIDQSNATGAIPVLVLDQADLSEEFINYICATTGAGDPVDTVVAVGAAYARMRVAVNGTFKYIQLYDA